MLSSHYTGQSVHLYTLMLFNTPSSLSLIKAALWTQPFLPVRQQNHGQKACTNPAPELNQAAGCEPDSANSLAAICLQDRVRKNYLLNNNSRVKLEQVLKEPLGGHQSARFSCSSI